jgi:hypothetical protein
LFNCGGQYNAYFDFAVEFTGAAIADGRPNAAAKAQSSNMQAMCRKGRDIHALQMGPANSTLIAWGFDRKIRIELVRLVRDNEAHGKRCKSMVESGCRTRQIIRRAIRICGKNYRDLLSPYMPIAQAQPK